jgi:hypothetical protein
MPAEDNPDPVVVPRSRQTQKNKQTPKSTPTTTRKHNNRKNPMVAVEVQTGSYPGEDDSIRCEDVYARGQGAKG